MALTVAINNQEVFGNKRVHEVSITFDSSYPAGGEALSARDCGLSLIDFIQFEPARGFGFDYDHTNAKVKAFCPAPPIIWEEQHTIASNKITLDYPAAYIFYVAQANASVHITDPAATLAANQCKPTVAMAFGVRTELSFHAGLSGVVYVGYITQAWYDVWANLVQSEAVTVVSGTGVGTLANVPIAIQSMRTIATTATNCCAPVDKDDTGITAEYELTQTTGGLLFLVADVVTGAVCTYIKKPAAGFLAERLIGEEAMTAAANILTPVKPLLLWGYGGWMVENGAAPVSIINRDGTLGGDEARFDFTLGQVIITEDAVTTGTGMYIWGRPEEIATIPLEVKNGTDLSHLSDVRAFVIGS